MADRWIYGSLGYLFAFEVNATWNICWWNEMVGYSHCFALLWFISSIRFTSNATLCSCLPSIAGFWTFMWFVGFCFLANQWQRTSPKELPLNQGADAARAAIAFSFFSIITWVGNPDTQKRNAGETIEWNMVELEVLGHSVELKPGAQSRAHWGGEIVHYGAIEKQAPLKYGRRAHTYMQGWEGDN